MGCNQCGRTPFNISSASGNGSNPPAAPDSMQTTTLHTTEPPNSYHAAAPKESRVPINTEGGLHFPKEHHTSPAPRRKQLPRAHQKAWSSICLRPSTPPLQNPCKLIIRRQVRPPAACLFSRNTALAREEEEAFNTWSGGEHGRGEHEG